MNNQKTLSPAWKRQIVKAPFLLLIPLGFAIPEFAARNRDWVENVYARSVYPVIKDAISACTRLVPFSLAELLIYALILLIPTLLIVCAVRSFRSKTPVRLISLVITLGIIAGVVLNLFYATWGLLYFREPLSSRMGLTVQVRSVDELERLTVRLAAEANRLRDEVTEDEKGVFAYPSGSASVEFAKLVPAYAALSGREPVFSGGVTRAKTVLWSSGLSWMGIAGIYIGLTAEPNVNVDQPPLLVLHAAAHEMAHQLGIASENEAEFAAFLACRSSEDASVQYSATMLALIVCGNALNGADSARYQALARTYSEAVWRDLADYSAYWKAFEGPVQETATSVNDQYLKHNAQESGVKSYGEVVDLLLAYYEDKNI